MNFEQKGFTLIEIAIVLTIISIIVGGILIGQSMIRAANLRNIQSEITLYKDAILQFGTKYGSLPGDMRTATRLWGRADGGADLTQNCAAPETDRDTANPQATCNGNGDGKITGHVSYVINNTELFRAWQHLSNAGFVTGSYTGVGGAVGSTAWRIATVGINVPESKKIGSGYYIAYAALGAACSAPNLWTGGETANPFQYISFGGLAPGGLPWTANLTPVEASSIDIKIDDGKPGTGNYTAFCANSCSDGTVAETANYRNLDESPTCTTMLRIK